MTMVILKCGHGIGITPKQKDRPARLLLMNGLESYSVLLAALDGVLCASVLGGSRKRIAAKQRKENAVFLGMESGWRTNASFDFIEPSARPQFHRNGV